MNQLDRAIEGAALAPLTSEQRRHLALLARRAFNRAYDRGEISEAAEFDAWRHQQCLQAVERRGLTACRQEDFLPLEAHFLRLLGMEVKAARVQDRADTDPRRQALFGLRREFDRVRDVIARPEDYVSAICRARYKTRDYEGECTARQLWRLMFDLRRNAQRRRAKGNT